MRFLLFIAVFFACACTSSTAGDAKQTLHQPERSSDKILLELFTSQGCSSCPPADKLVSSLAQADTNLIVVSYHVDYWDRLGWKDPFSQHDYTLRQQQYARLLHAQSVYTPQAVVQGQFEMVGSNQHGILNAVKTAAAQTSDVNFESHTFLDNRSVTVTCHLNKTVTDGYQINAVLVQNNTNTSVVLGENSGRQLTGYHVARSMKSKPITKEEDKMQLLLPDDVKPENASVIVFIENVSSGKIVAVRQMAL